VVLQNSALRPELFELEAKWNINISETNEVILNQGKTKGILPVHNSCALIPSCYQQNKWYLLCNFLKLNSGNNAVYGGERIYFHLSASPKLRPHISNREGSQRAIQEARVRSQNWLLPCGTTSCSCHQGSLLSS